MAFTELQKSALKAKLNHHHVKTREANGTTLSYLEGWHAIAEANRIFGFDSWDRQTQSPSCLWQEQQRGQTVCFYSTKVRITVRAGETTTVREGIGTGLGRSPQPELAHEIALKAAETDATKRALATFGNPFGLALYDRDQTQVTRPRRRNKAQQLAEPALSLVLGTGKLIQPGSVQEYVTEMLRAISELASVEAVYGFWTANLAGLTDLRERSKAGDTDPVEQVILALKQRLREIGAGNSDSSGAGNGLTNSLQTTPSPVLLPKERRVRDKGHLVFVASQPCLVCGRKPAQAHHLRFAQPRGMGLKVSDEYTVPLCNAHHDQLHRTGDERAWWARHGIIDPLKYAARLWAATRGVAASGSAPDVAGAEANSNTDPQGELLAPLRDRESQDRPS